MFKNAILKCKDHAKKKKFRIGYAITDIVVLIVFASLSILCISISYPVASVSQITISLEAVIVALLGVCLTAYIFLHSADDASNKYVGLYLKRCGGSLKHLTICSTVFLLLTIVLLPIYTCESNPQNQVDIKFPFLTESIIVEICPLTITIVSLYAGILISGMTLFIKHIIAYKQQAVKAAKYIEKTRLGEISHKQRTPNTDNTLHAKLSKLLCDTNNILSLVSLGKYPETPKTGRFPSKELDKISSIYNDLVDYLQAAEYIYLEKTSGEKSNCDDMPIPKTVYQEALNLWDNVKERYIAGRTISSRDFKESEFNRTNARKSGFYNCSFEDADLSNGDFRDSNFEQCVFLGANLRGTKASRCNFEKSDLMNICLIDQDEPKFNDNAGSSVKSIWIDYATELHESNFKHSTLVGMNIRGASDENKYDLSRSVFNDSNLNNTYLCNVDLTSSAFDCALMFDAVFDNVGLGDCSFKDARATSSRFINIQPSKQKQGERSIRGVNFNNILCTKTQWVNVNLENSSFVNALFPKHP